VLLFSRTTGYRHDSIPAGVAAFQELGEAHGFDVTATEDEAAFRGGALAAYSVVVFLNTSGEVLDDSGRARLTRYLRTGGGFMGVHCAAATEYRWPFFGGLVGAWFDTHPPVGPATIRVDDRAHPATAHLGDAWPRVDEWYEFRTPPRPGARVLLSLEPDNHGDAARPLAWCQEYGGARSFYTALGHTTESYAEPEFRAHLLGGLLFAAGAD
jgi:type 1 glutamine amidotransferase